MIAARRGITHAVTLQAPEDLNCVRSRDELRGVLFEDLLAGSAAWLSMDGLRLPATRDASRLLRASRGFRQAPEEARGQPHTAVLDWSTVRSPSVEAVAGFPLLARSLASSGASLVCCEPREGLVADVLSASGLVGRLGLAWVGEEGWEGPGFRHPLAAWLPSVRAREAADAQERAERRIAGAPGDGRRRGPGSARFRPDFRTSARGASPLRLLGEVAVVRAADGHAAADPLVDLVEAGANGALAAGALDAAGWTFEAFGRELVANALALDHGAARTVSAAVGIQYGQAPAMEFAIVDDGIGIGARLRQQQLAKLGQFTALALTHMPERHYVGALFAAVSGSDEARLVGRGMVHTLRDLLEATDALVAVRSGGVGVVIGRAGVRLCVVSSESCGLGTAIRVSIPLPASGR